MKARGTQVAPPSTSTPIEWLSANLFSTWYNTVLSLVVVVLLALTVPAVLRWILGAEWSAVTFNLKLIAVGQYPTEELWRVGVCVLMLSFLAGVSWSAWRSIARPFCLSLTAGLVVLAVIPADIRDLTVHARIWLACGAALVGTGYFSHRYLGFRQRWLVLGWLAAFALMVLLLRGVPGIPWLPYARTGVWGGLLLTFLLALIGMTASLPLGVLLAMGRRSSLPVVKVFCVLFIELVRGVPLVTLLFMTQVILPLFLPEGLVIDRFLRSLMAITLFSSAYMAENVRGGLQTVPEAQVEAGKALGLSGFSITTFIVLPQALRASIPTIVGQFISLFKDTSLVATVGLLDLVGIGKSIILGNVEWIDAQAEIYLFVAFVYWIFTFALSQSSQRLEERLGVGRR